MNAMESGEAWFMDAVEDNPGGDLTGRWSINLMLNNDESVFASVSNAQLNRLVEEAKLHGVTVEIS